MEANYELKDKIEYIKMLETINEGLRRYIKEMSGVYKIIEALNSVKDIEMVSELFLDLLDDILSIEAINLYFYDNNKNEFVKIKNKKENVIEEYKKIFKIEGNIYDWVLKKGHFTIIPKPKNLNENISFAIAPILTANRILGYLEIILKKSENKITQNEFSIINLIIKQFAIIVDNLRSIQHEKDNIKKMQELEELKNDILVTSSHELRTPLTILKGASKLIETKMEQNMWEEEDKKLYLEFIKNINKQIEILEEIVNSMFLIISLESGIYNINKEKTNLEEIIKSIIKKYKIKYKNIDFFIDLNLHNNEIFTDKLALKKVLDNIISNACKFIDGNGKVEIKAEENENYILISVKDNGIGIEKDKIDKIFDIFYRVDKSLTRKKGGLGIGLYLSKKIVELLKGQIWIESEIFQGTKVFIKIPNF